MARDPERYARNSFTWRGMTAWQRWSITVVAAVVIIAAIVYAVG